MSLLKNYFQLKKEKKQTRTTWPTQEDFVKYINNFFFKTEEDHFAFWVSV